MTLDLDFDDVDAELAASVRRYCDDHVSASAAPGDGEAQALPDGWWAGLAELGVLGLATLEGGGSVTTIVAAMEELGRANAPGPLAGTFLALQLMDEATRPAVIDGSTVVAVGVPPLVPWLPLAGLVVVLDGSSARLGRVVGDVEVVETLAGDPWGRGSIEIVADLGSPATAIAVAELAVAAYLVGSGEFLLQNVAVYAADRVQFRKPIGTFQSVAHPLADCYVHLAAARTLTRLGAQALDQGGPDALAAAATARLSATRAAMAAALQSHQTYGAMGFTVEGPIGNRSARIRQLSLFPRSSAADRETLLTALGLGHDDTTPRP
jgi:alkylation response protein AidB-like acyl-CoA dehydrogenase